MQYIKLAEDLKFSRIIHGLWRLADWNLSTNDTQTLIEQCLDRGITTFDHADIYGNYSCEKLFGQALAQKPSLRESMQLVTKCGIKLTSDKYPERKINFYDTSKEHIINSANQSLKNLNTDYVDVLLIHRPDPFMDPQEVADAFIQLKEEGKVRYFGVSNFKRSQFDLLQSFLPFSLITNQIEVSPTYLNHFEEGTIEQCQQHKIAPMAWSPLGGGSIFTAEDERSIRVRNKLTEIGEEIGAKSLDQVVYAWLLAHPATIMPIVGSGKMNRIDVAIQALDLKVNRMQWFQILEASKGRPVD
ncbi:aldo/keto reductase [Priestia flexa]|jgi:predicted oxidoreductase|uniref:Aldo/keto reductase n=1 Tax=Priestia flexa TaxID=86664 RepID=A0A8I1MG48_9BACI|nr:aldo/keto reductase [Priestia flexa]MBN8252525.1 aldo/keto reductase [Priestia flexa]MBN8433995.1 aldo/keto reductase [Priestia flexa]MCA0966525.1 aldo/keto reductase [Priestia flexa]RIV12071.1 aldo/keto reductase family oxidoreductase [Priestia flexa]UIR31169.1 aldo/keto reductase [Priestia flexa]